MGAKRRKVRHLIPGERGEGPAEVGLDGAAGKGNVADLHPSCRTTPHKK